MANRWHILAAKAQPGSNQPGLTNWQFGALMEDVIRENGGSVVREPTYSETQEFQDSMLLHKFHWAVALTENSGFSAKMHLPSGVEFEFWTDREMDPTKRAVAADPMRYKTWMYTDLKCHNQVRSRYLSTPHSTSDGRKIQYAYSTQKNIAGYFLTWRQIVNSNGIHYMSDRDEIIACKLRREARQIMIDRSK